MKLRSTFIALLFLLVAVIATAQVKSPDTKAGKRLTELIATVASGDEAVHKAFVEKSMTKEFRDKHPMEQHLGMLSQIHDNEQLIEIDKIEKSSEYEVVAIMKGKSGGSLRVTIRTEDKAPFAINEMGLQPMGQ